LLQFLLPVELVWMKKMVNSFIWNNVVFQLKWLFSICPSEVLTFSNWTLTHGKSPFFKKIFTWINCNWTPQFLRYL
jgi:hypothetical protein